MQIGKTPEQIVEPIRYCLYARKSSESDERQAMSIDSQIKEMGDLGKKESLDIVEVRQESHSAKNSGQRPVFMSLLNDIREGRFTGILTWAPDRLSRNAGDLGMLVDLMDQGKLIHIKTFSQAFSNNPNEKFLLMILCSQAKLENDQKGINVKRGIRAKCEKGWRPGIAPLGYMNRAYNGVKDIIVDPDRGHFVTEMFNKVAEGSSGRGIKKWADKIGFKSRLGNKLSLGMIYLMLHNPFYTGRFEFPVGTGIWYQGAHKPLVDRKVFKLAREQMIAYPKVKWGSRNLIFRGVFKCASCQSSMTGTEKFRVRKFREPKRHAYYYCTKYYDENCKEKPVKEEILIGAIVRYINFMNIAHNQTFKLTPHLVHGMDNYKKIQEQALLDQNINPKLATIRFTDYAKHVLRNGADQDKLEIVKVFGKQLYFHNSEICGSPIK